MTEAITTSPLHKEKNDDQASPTSVIVNKNKLLSELIFAYGYQNYTIQWLSESKCEQLEGTVPNILYIEKSSEHVLRFAVKKAYTNNFQSRYVTAEDLKINRLPNNQDDCESIKEQIFSLASEYDLVNIFNPSELNDLIVSPEYRKKYRTFMLSVAYLVCASLLTEITFAGLQFAYGSEGFQTLFLWVAVPLAIAILGYTLAGVSSPLDLRLNLKVVSPFNDALLSSFYHMPTSRKWLQHLMNLSVASQLLIASPAGSTGSILFVIELMLPEKSCPGIDTCMALRKGAIALIIYTIITGDSYYYVFTRAKREKTFKAWNDDLDAPQLDINLARSAQIRILNLFNEIFRSTLLVATTLPTLKYIFSISPTMEMVIAGLVCAGVFMDIETARGYSTRATWSQPEWAYIKDEEVTKTLKTLPYKKTYSYSDTLLGLGMAGGLLPFAFDASLYFKIFTPLVSSAIFLDNIMAQRDRSARKAIAEQLGPQLIERKLEAQYKALHKENTTENPLLPHDQFEKDIEITTSMTELSLEEKTEKQVKLSERQYSAIAAALGVHLTWLDYLSVGGSLGIRFAVQVTASTIFNDVWHLVFSSAKVTGAVVSFSLPTLLNFGQNCGDNMLSYKNQKEAEAFLLYMSSLKQDETDAQPRSIETIKKEFEQWKKENWATIFYKTTVNDLGTYKQKDTHGAIKYLSEALGHQFNPV